MKISINRLKKNIDYNISLLNYILSKLFNISSKINHFYKSKIITRILIIKISELLKSIKFIERVVNINNFSNL